MKILSPFDMRRRARDVVNGLTPKDSGATVIALSGDLGAGKTTFVQGAAEALGIVDIVPSPTFIIERVYDLKGQQFSKMVHIDAYRLESAEELTHLGWNNLISDAQSIVFIEWAEKFKSLIPADALWFRMDHVDEETRKMTKGAKQSE